MMAASLMHTRAGVQTYKCIDCRRIMKVLGKSESIIRCGRCSRLNREEK